MITTVLAADTADLVVGTALVVAPGPTLVEDIVFGVAGAQANVDPPAAPDFSTGLQQAPMNAFYYRIWVDPPVLRLVNPQIGVPITFGIFNAYPESNTLTTVTATDAAGLTLSFSAPQSYGPVEYREVTLTIGVGAPPQIAASYTFDFAQGSADFDISGVLAEFLTIVPDPPITETLEWLTDVMISHDGTEQRVSLREAPRRSINYTIIVDSAATRRELYLRWYSSSASAMAIPFYQYGGVVTIASAIASSIVWLDTSRSDLRSGEFAIIYDPATEQSEVLRIDEVFSDRITLEQPLASATRPGMMVAPMFTCRVGNRTGLSMDIVTGRLVVDATTIEQRLELVRPGATATLTTLTDIPVLNRRPLGSGVGELFDTGQEIIDNLTGVPALRTAWAHPRIEGPRSFLVQRFLQPDEMDWWRLFLKTANGQQNPFWMPTWQEDQLLLSQPVEGSNSITLIGATFAQKYGLYESYGALQLETTAGIIHRKVLDFSEDAGNTLVLLSDPLVGGEAVVSRVSYLNLARLSSDSVKLVHEHGFTYVEMATRIIDQ